MKYMLLIYLEEQALSEVAREACYVESTRLAHELHEAGQFLDANPLQPVATATTVQVADGRKVITDGPFAETREQLGGYFLVDVPDLDQALAIAARVPAAKFGRVEVRPIVSLPDLPPVNEPEMPMAGAVK